MGGVVSGYDQRFWSSGHEGAPASDLALACDPGADEDTTVGALGFEEPSLKGVWWFAAHCGSYCGGTYSNRWIPPASLSATTMGGGLEPREDPTPTPGEADDVTCAVFVVSDAEALAGL